jgi:hypothetical protein
MTPKPVTADDAEMVRRAAQACRNMTQQAQLGLGSFDWFDWVPQHLDQIAARLAASVDRTGDPQ